MAKEGFYFVLPVVLISLAFFIAHLLLPAAIFALFALIVAFFFRDPERKPTEKDEALVAPADGRVMSVEKMGDGWRISIFMSPLDVHVNRSPCSGKILEMEHRGGGHLPAYKRESEENEKVIFHLNCSPWKIKLVLIAGILARRIKPYRKSGDRVRMGERIGIILLGSRADLYFPEQFQPAVAEGERVKAGVSILARRIDED